MQASRGDCRRLVPAKLSVHLPSSPLGPWAGTLRDPAAHRQSCSLVTSVNLISAPSLVSHSATSQLVRGAVGMHAAHEHSSHAADRMTNPRAQRGAGVGRVRGVLFAPPNRSGMKITMASFGVYKPPGRERVSFGATVLSAPSEEWNVFAAPRRRRGHEERSPGLPPAPRGAAVVSPAARRVRSHRSAHVLARVTPKQTLPTGCPWSQRRRRLSTLTPSARSICHSLKIELSLRSGQVRPRCVLLHLGRKAEHSHIPGGVVSLHPSGRVGLCLQPPLKGCCTTVTDSGMSLVICSVTVSLHK